jgi:type VI secretion system secreted protein VgrG
MDLLGSAAAEATLSIDVEAKEGAYLVLSMTGQEHLGQMYEYTVELAQVEEESLIPMSEPKKPDMSKLIGTAATISMKLAEDKRYFHGYLSRVKRGEKRGRYTLYTMTLRPGIWFMTQAKNSRVFQEKSVKEVITEVLSDYSIDADWRLDSESAYPKLDYCVQYNETDFDFMHRLIEEVGIYYFFEHQDGSHKVVFIDAMGLHKPNPSKSTLTWRNAMTSAPTVMAWHVQQEVRSAKVILRDYDFLDPATTIEGTEAAKKPPEMLGNMEWFEYPAKVVQNRIKPDKDTKSADAAAQRAKVRIEELLTLYSSATGTTNMRDLGIGMTFDVEIPANKDDNGTYLMVSAVYRIDFGAYESIDELKSPGNHEGYFCDFLCISKDAPNYRTPRITPRPVIAGPQTATVVGQTDAVTETDKHGRIKVQFPWDRVGNSDQDSSCWLRVAQPWAGKGYGMMSLPRVGDEVVVHFLHGDPDHPIVIGSVYNDVNMMAWTLPEQATVTGFKSRTSDENADETTANELRFDDKKDNEYIWFHAERDFHRQVEHDAFDWVGNNESVKVTMTRKEVIGENWFMDVTKDVMHNLGKDLHVNVAGDIFYTGAATFQLKLTKDFNAKIDGDLGATVGGKVQLKVSKDVAIESSEGKIMLKAPTIILDATTGLTLKVGGSLVNLSSAAVDIVGTMVNVNSGGAGGSASPAQPGEATEAKKEDSIAPASQSDYDKTFKDPMPDSDGGTGENTSKAS